MDHNGNRRKQAKRWCFTLNNYTEQEEAAAGAAAEGGDIAAAVIGREVGEQGTPHLQGYLELVRKCTLVALKRRHGWLARAHLEVARGTPVQAAEYCRKEGQVLVEFGVFRDSPHASNGLARARAIIGAGGAFEELYQEEQTFEVAVRYEKGLRSYADFAQASNELRVGLRVLYYHGAPGSGKTRAVYEETAADRVYWHACGNWFDGYAGQEVAVFDDFNPGGISFQWLLRLLDIYPLRVPVKGGFRHWKPRTIFITSNVPPDALYDTPMYARSMDPDVNPLLRRLTEVKEFHK